MFISFVFALHFPILKAEKSFFFLLSIFSIIVFLTFLFVVRSFPIFLLIIFTLFISIYLSILFVDESWRSRDNRISDVLWTPSHGRANAGRAARTYIQQLCEDTGCSPGDPPEAMNDRERWRERMRDIRTDSTRWYIYIYIAWLVGCVLWHINPCMSFNDKPR